VLRDHIAANQTTQNAFPQPLLHERDGVCSGEQGKRDPGARGIDVRQRHDRSIAVAGIIAGPFDPAQTFMLQRS